MYGYCVTQSIFVTYSDWTEAEVVENYLKPIGMEFMSKAFMENHITGAVLLALREEHIKELGCAVLGDRILFMEYLQLLKKHKKDLDRSRALWSGQTPINSCAYHQNCGKYLFFLVCGCCVRKVDWRITGQGIRWRKMRAAIDCCGDGKSSQVTSLGWAHYVMYLRLFCLWLLGDIVM